jgi:hypothetical protein
MFNEYRRKDYFFPRSIREAFGRDETYEPEIRCCSELFQEQERRINQAVWIPAAVSLALLVGVLLFVVSALR